jgi:murein DD-endopeptidase MepM/ murein hydrolase activator NlpD
MKLNPPKWAVRGLILSVLSFGLAVLLGWRNSPVIAQPATLIANDRAAQINIRSYPSTASHQVGFAFAGDRIQVLNQTQGRDGYTWYNMQSDRSGIVGWVRGDLVRLARASQPRAVIPQPSARIQSPNVLQSGSCAPVYPVPMPIVNAGYGTVPDPFIPGQQRFHNGIDFDGRMGDSINSPICGVVSYVGRVLDETSHEWGYGLHVKIRDDQGRIHVFGHTSKAYVKVGETVKPGQLIAAIGSTGNSTGPHLHYEIRQGGDTYQFAINPTPFLAQAGQGGVTQSRVQTMPERSPLRF